MRFGWPHLILLPCWLPHVWGFTLTSPLPFRSPAVTSSLAAATTTSDSLVAALRDQQDDASVLRLIQSLEESYALTNNNDSSIEPLLGLYNVSRTITARPGENPVGGK